jgi:2'-5' RNA ligase
MSRIRAFVAVSIAPPPPLRAAIAELRALGSPLKAVDPDHLHVTLKFLGDVDAASVDQLARIVRNVTASHSIFAAALCGLGVFPHAARPSVVWAGFDGANPLIKIAADLEEQFRELGFPPEGRGFTPHVTLARLKGRPPAGFAELVERHAANRFGSVSIEELVLFRSDLEREGPRYTSLATVKFSAKESGA